MPNLLTQEPRPHTVVEWLFAALVEPMYEVAQRTGLLAQLAVSRASAEELADRLELSQRGVRCVLNSLVAAGIVAQANGIYYQITQEVPDTFSRNAAALNELLHSLEAGLFDQVTEDGILPLETPQALVALGIAEVVGTHLVLTEPGRRYFTPGHECYLGGHVHYVWKLLSHVIPHLDEVVKTGQPCLRAEKSPGFFSPLVETLFPVNYDAARQMADHLVTLKGVNTVLDLGAGSAVWSIALAQRDTRIQVNALDLPPVLEITRAFARRSGVYSQYRFLPGDYMALDRWGEAPYDLIYLGYCCPGAGEAENRHMLTMCTRNLRPGGYIALADYLPRQDRTGPLLDVLFSILMLCITESGDTYPRETYEAWCRDAGLDQLEWISVPGWSVPILLARNVGTRYSATTPADVSVQQNQSTAQATATVPAEQEIAAVKVPFVPPSQIIETTFAFAQSCILLAAVELELFTWIAHGIETPERLAQQAKVSEPALVRLLGALNAMGFLQKTASGYALTPLSERYLVLDRETYIGDIALQIRQEWDAWIRLTDIVRTGQSARFVNEEPLGGHFFEHLVEHLFPLIYPLMRRICEYLEVGTRYHGLHVVDLGAGTAPGAIAALELDLDARAVVIDFPPVLARAQAHARERGVDSRMEYWPTALDTLELPATRFDLAIASHVFRIVGADMTRRLIDQCYQALKPGGRLVIIETYKEPDRDWKLFPHIVSVNMLVNTRHGDAFSSQQVREWLHTAGFQVEELLNYGPDPVLIATRP